MVEDRPSYGPLSTTTTGIDRQRSRPLRVWTSCLNGRTKRPPSKKWVAMPEKAAIAAIISSSVSRPVMVIRPLSILVVGPDKALPQYDFW